MMKIRCIAGVLTIVTASATAAAEGETPSNAPAPTPVVDPQPTAWHQGPAGRRRILRAGLAVAGGAIYFSSETFLKSSLAADSCRWCEPLAVDRTVRSALVWADIKLAAKVADIDGYVLAPTFGIGILALSAGAHRGTNEDFLSRAIDDTLPVVESIVIGQLITQVVKFSVGRQRPFVHFARVGREPEVDDNMSFLSGHSSLVFSIATSAGMVAHRRGYSTEPLIWSVGMGLAATTAYLRIGADKHYLTDVLAGSALGAAVGVLTPMLLYSETLERANIAIVPNSNGISVSGAF
jgi:membrane-associated phospholipid phosphatase